uniref:Uncharacterized protein n=1 Tax=Arundo donax TaxID=35708 RepID=A0A0A8ZZ16_ARUDO
MVDTSPHKPTDFSIEKLCEMFCKVFEQQQTKVTPEILKQSLEPNPVKLSGPENYVSWAHNVHLILNSHDYENLLSYDENKSSGLMLNKSMIKYLCGC